MSNVVRLHSGAKSSCALLSQAFRGFANDLGSRRMMRPGGGLVGFECDVRMGASSTSSANGKVVVDMDE